MKPMVSACIVLALMSCHGNPDTTHLEKELLHLEAKIPLPGVRGRIDHMAYDPEERRVFVAALGNNTVEVVDLKTHTRSHSIGGLDEPQGVLFIPARLVVANGGNGDCTFYDGRSYSELGRVSLGRDADNVRYDGKKVYVGFGNGGIAVIDPAAIKKVGELPLKGHPESFRLQDSGSMFINVPDNGKIVVADVGTLRVRDHWKNSGASANFPMALDEHAGHLFVVYRHPAQVRVIDGRTGATQSAMPCIGDADDVFFDSIGGLLLVSGGEGFIDVFRGGTLINHIATRKGARTSLWLPKERKLILAVPARGGETAALWIYGL